MKANELRLGNSILCEGMECNIDEISQEKVCIINHPAYDFEFITVDIDDIKPIQLTEEWLLKFGFDLEEDLGDMIYYHKGKYGICFDHEELFFYKNIGNDKGYHILIYDSEHFQHVHQLQNLYFALTGKELQYETY